MAILDSSVMVTQHCCEEYFVENCFQYRTSDEREHKNLFKRQLIKPLGCRGLTLG